MRNCYIAGYFRRGFSLIDGFGVGRKASELPDFPTSEPDAKMANRSPVSSFSGWSQVMIITVTYCKTAALEIRHDD
jgi:hypothetical protein